MKFFNKVLYSFPSPLASFILSETLAADCSEYKKHSFSALCSSFNFPTHQKKKNYVSET